MFKPEPLRVIRIHDAPPMSMHCHAEGYWIQRCVYDYSKKNWEEVEWIDRRFPRRCDASRWAGRHYPEYELQHWRTL